MMQRSVRDSVDADMPTSRATAAMLRPSERRVRLISRHTLQAASRPRCLPRSTALSLIAIAADRRSASLAAAYATLACDFMSRFGALSGYGHLYCTQCTQRPPNHNDRRSKR
jgi:hypothetical protein